MKILMSDNCFDNSDESVNKNVLMGLKLRLLVYDGDVLANLNRN